MATPKGLCNKAWGSAPGPAHPNPLPRARQTEGPIVHRKRRRTRQPKWTGKNVSNSERGVKEGKHNPGALPQALLRQAFSLENKKLET